MKALKYDKIGNINDPRLAGMVVETLVEVAKSDIRHGNSEAQEKEAFEHTYGSETTKYIWSMLK